MFLYQTLFCLILRQRKSFKALYCSSVQNPLITPKFRYQMSKEYSIFRKYSTLAEAEELVNLLNESGIETILGDNVPAVDVTFTGGNSLSNEIEVRIKQVDFTKAELILKTSVQDLIDKVDKSYYLYEFSDEELFEVVLKSDEWSELDYTLAQKILEDRGKPIDIALINSLKKQRIDDLAKPDEGQRTWIIVGYALSLIGGFLGIVLGYLLWTSKKTLPNGQKVYTYKPNDRKHGRYIFFIGLIIFPALLIWRLIETN